MTTPQLVAVGHVVQDLMPGGWRLGGTAAFAAVQAQRLGLRTAVVTRASPDAAIAEVLPGIEFAGRLASVTTAFENIYDQGRRRQRIPRLAEPLGPEDVPISWRNASIVMIGPVCGEIAPDMSTLFPNSLVGVAAQGWLRQRDKDRHVQPQVWDGSPFWSACRALFASDEDLGPNRSQLTRWIDETPIVVLTDGHRGVKLHTDGAWRNMAAFPSNEVDPTGAGDIFAGAFLVRYYETEDPAQSARFASAAAACSVAAPGLEAVPQREQIEARMNEHPEIVLQ